MINKIVKGSILNKYGEPIPSCKVELYLKQLRRDILLAETYSDQCGMYSIQYAIDDSKNNSNKCSNENKIPLANIYLRAYICKSSLANTGFDMFCQSNQECTDYIQSGILYDADEEEIIDLIQGNQVKEYPKYDKLTLEIRRLIYNMDITDLEVNSEHNDIEYVSKLLGIDQKQVLYIIICHRLEASPSIGTRSATNHLKGYVYYPFLELGIFSDIEAILLQLYTDFKDIDDILSQIKNKIVDLDEQSQRNTLSKGVEENLISEISDDELQEIIEILNSLRKDNIISSPITTGNTSIEELLDLSGTSSELRESFIDAYTANSGILESTLEELKANDPNFTEDMARDLQHTFALDGLVRGRAPMTRELVGELSRESGLWVADFAGRSHGRWESYIRSSQTGYPDDTEGDTEDERIANYAARLEENFREEYPVAAAAHAVAIEVPSAESARTFIAQNVEMGIADYPMGDLNIDGLVNEIQTLSQSNFSTRSLPSQDTINDAKRLQRVLRITTNPTLSKILYEKDLCAQSIYLMGVGNFINQMIELGVDEDVAYDAYESATSIYGELLSEFGRLNNFTNTLIPSAVSGVTPSDDQLDKMSTYKSLAVLTGYEQQQNIETLSSDTNTLDVDYNTLFGNLSYCECEQCKSVHGAAAYMVDMLNFLSYRSMKNESSTKSAKNILFERRSDIGKIELSCENTNTKLPYIDLVCEILENSIKPNIGAYQTTKKEDELKAMPEHINNNVYKELSRSITFNNLPFNLYNEEAREYLNSINIKLSDFVSIFSNNLEEKAYLVALESLGFNYFEGEFMLKPSNITQADKDVLTSNIINFTDVLNKASLTYNQLKDVLSTEYINPNNQLVVLNSNSCNINEIKFKTSYGYIAYNLPVLTRLQKSTGWRFCDIDMAIQSSNIGNKKVGKNLFIQIKAIMDLKEKIRLSIEEIINFYSGFNTAKVYLENNEEILNLYDKLFLNKTVLKTEDIDQAFVSISGNEKILDHKETVLASLSLNESELNLILDNLKYLLDKNLNDNILLTLNNLSIVTRYTYLARSMGYSIKDLLTQILIIYDDYNFDIFANPTTTYDFINKCEDMIKYNFDLKTLKYLLRYTTGEDSLISKDDIVKQYVSNLRNNLSHSNTNLHDDIMIEQTSIEFNLKTSTAAYILTQMPYGLLREMEYIKPNLINFMKNDLDKLLLKNDEDEYLYEINQENFKDIFFVYYLIFKMSILIKKLKIETEELIFIQQNSYRLNLMNFAYLPIRETDDDVMYDQWLNLVKLYKLKKMYPKHDETSIFKVLETATQAHTLSEFNQELSNLTYWDIKTLETLQTHFFVESAQHDIDSILRYYEQVSNIYKSGIKVDDILEYANIDIYTYENNNKAKSIANSIIQVVKSKFSNENWLNISANIQDKIRVKKRDSLVSYLLNKDSNKRFKITDDLYEYLLIDSQMSPCQLTTRILQANATIQLFVQRCLMNLENYKVSLNDTDWEQWNIWMKNYRVWEANRLVFLYPENWIEPELRRDKTPFFKELEDKLNQNEITNEYAEELFMQYIEKLEEVAHLKTCAIHKQVENDKKIVHIVARTNEQPYNYYYRNQEIIDGNMIWGPWEKINIGINAEQMVLFILNRKLHMFWLDIDDKPYKEQDLGNQSSSGKDARKYMNIKLSWSVYKNNNWTPIKTYPNDIPMTVYDSFCTQLHNIVNLRVGLNSNKSGATFVIYNNLRNLKGDIAGAYYLYFNGKMYDIKRTIYTPFTQTPYTQDIVNSTLAQAYSIYFKCLDSKKVYNSLFNRGVDQELISCIGSNYQISTTDWYNKLAYVPQYMNYEYNYLKKNDTDDITLWIRDDFKYDWGMVLRYKPCNLIIPLDTNPKYPDGPFVYQDNNREYYITLYYKFTQTSDAVSWQAYPLYHPYTNIFIRELDRCGVDGLLNRNIQLMPNTTYPNSFNFKATYNPHICVGIQMGDKDYKEDPNSEIVDFSDYGSYSMYNWEIFFHIPMLLANKLNQNQKFEEAQKWYHYIFNPTLISDEPTPNKYWITKPFYKTTTTEYANEEINNLMKNKISTQNQSAINAWRKNPFDPHKIARTRTVAYQKNVVMKYIDNIIDWADYLFTKDTFESINEATQLYVIAAKILGPKPIKLKAKDNIVLTYNQLEAFGIDKFGNGYAENAIPIKIRDTMTKDEKSQLKENLSKLSYPNLSSLYFCITPNDILFKYWDRVADRLFKIRNCMNIEGILRELDLFEPPIDPSILVKATAAGVDINSILDDTSSINVPYYRFKVLVKKASELCFQLQYLGKSLLKILETKDADELANISSTVSNDILDLLKTINEKEIDSAQCDLDSLINSKDTLQIKKNYYSNLEKLIPAEKSQISMITFAMASKITASVLSSISGGLSVIPGFDAGISGFGVHSTISQPEYVDGFQAFADMSSSAADTFSLEAELSELLAEVERNYKEWQYEIESANSDINSIDQQIKSAQIRLDIAKDNLQNQILEIRDQEILSEFFESKYTNSELYNWMITQVSTVYFKAYKLTYNVAKKAQKAYEYELGKKVSFIQVGYWDSLRKGLLAGDRLYQDIKTMEMSYIDENERQYELTKNISLNKLNPIALELLKENGYCYISIPELLFDMDYHNNYFRRIKSVKISIKCEKEPYTTISCILTLSKNEYRVNEDVTNGYIKTANDNRFVSAHVPTNSIQTSDGNYDDGMFEFNFNDERYLPFEGAGAISEWSIQLNSDYKQFDFESITDVIIHMDYTAKGATDTEFLEIARAEIKEAISTK